jgi:HAE1 family hydrophobic/amphiphilic exporter-1
LTDDIKERPKSFVISADFRKEFSNLDDLKVTIVEVSGGPPTAAALDIKIVGPDLNVLKTIALELKEQFSEINGLVNITTDFDNLSDEVNLIFDQDKLRLYGLTNQQVALAIQTYTNGIESGKLEIGGEDFDIRVFQENSNTKNINELESLLISTPLGAVPISFFAETVDNEGVQFIPRVNEERSTRVTSDLNEGTLLADLKPSIDEIITNYDLPDEYSFDLGGEDEDIQESFADLFSSMFIAVILILIVLVVQFNSFRQTFMILLTIPFAIIGIFPGLALLGLPLSFPAFLGIVMLSGIVVNDAIVMIDQVNYNRNNGWNVKDSLIESCTSRLIPIILTSLTTILGLLPLSLSDDFWRGLGFSVIFGLLTATLLTLIIIPIFYTWLYREKPVKVESVNGTIESINLPN